VASWPFGEFELWPYHRAGCATDDTCFNRPAPAAKSLYEGIRRPCRGEGVCRNAGGDGANRRAPAAEHLGVGLRRPCKGRASAGMLGKRRVRDARSRLFVGFTTRRATFSLAANSAASSFWARFFSVNSEPHTEARPSVRLCVALIIGYFKAPCRLVPSW
jgi:hypothetical protein